MFGKIKEIMRESYIDPFENSIRDKLDAIPEERFTKEEIDKGLERIIPSMTCLIRRLDNYADDPHEYLLILGDLKKAIEGSDTTRIQHTLEMDDIRSFLNKDEKKVSRKLGRKQVIDSERMPEYLNIMQDLTKDCVEFCFNKFKEDIHTYQQNRPLTTFTEDQKARASKKVSKPSRKTPMEAILEERNNSDDKTALISLDSQDSLIPPSKSPSPDNVTDTLQSGKADSVEKV